MKNLNNHNSRKTVHSKTAITATLLEPRLLKKLIEKLAGRHYAADYVFEKAQPGWEAIETSTIEADVTVDINLSSETDLIDMPSSCCFLFTCIKEKGGEYNLRLSTSLS